MLRDRITALLQARASTIMLEQGFATVWSFALGAIIAKLGGKDFFGLYATFLAVQYFTAGPLSAMTVAITSTDRARLRWSQQAYLHTATLASAKLAITAGSITSVAIMVIAAQQTVLPTMYVLPLAIVFVFSSLVSDILRRSLMLGHHYKVVTLVSAARIVLLLVASGIILTLTTKSVSAYAVAGTAVVISATYCLALIALALRTSNAQRPMRAKYLHKVALFRQIRIGGWGFAAGIVMTALDQGTLVVIGMAGRTSIAGELRAATYLFGLMSPVLLVLDLLMPSIAMKLGADGRSVSSSLKLAAVGGASGALAGAGVVLLTIMFWLPGLGPAYANVAPITFLAGIAFACMMARSFLMPLVRVQAPQAVLGTSIIGTAVGLGYITLMRPINAMSVQEGLLISALSLALCTLSACLFVSFRQRKTRT